MLKLKKKDSKMKNTVSSKKYKKSVYEICLELSFLLLSITFIAYLIWVLVNNSNDYTVSNDATHYYLGQEYTINEGSTMVVDSQGNTILKNGTSEQEMSSIVIYETLENKIILPKDMIYYDPRSNTSRYVPYFSEVKISEVETKVSKDNKSADLNQGFIYDGSNYYVFLEPMSVEFNGYQVTLSSLSYVEAVYPNSIVVFDYETKETVVEQLKTEVLATPTNGGYQIALVNDALINNKDEKSLLFSKPDLLDSIFE